MAGSAPTYQTDNYTKEFTLVFIRKDRNVLLGLKKRGFGVGKWNGFGGKVEEGEKVLEGAIRELKEESNLTVNKADMTYSGYVRYDRADSTQIDIVHVFTASKFIDDVAESEEMAPKWFAIDEIPYEEMWVDSKYWLPIVLKGKRLSAKFVLRGERDIEGKSIEELDVPELVDN